MAFESTHGGAVKPGDYDNDRDMFYCQDPSSWWFTANGSTPFGAEQADDIPDDLYGMSFNTIGFFVGEWASNWQDPVGVFVNIYNAECPPSQDPAYSYYYLWSELGAYIVYDDPGWMAVYACTAMLPDVFVVEYDMSLGFVVDLDWGQNAPYGGVVMTEDYDVYGCGQAYWDGTHWGAGRWTAIGDYFGFPTDIAYCIGIEMTATEAASWGTVKSLY